MASWSLSHGEFARSLGRLGSGWTAGRCRRRPGWGKVCILQLELSVLSWENGWYPQLSSIFWHFPSFSIVNHPAIGDPPSKWKPPFHQSMAVCFSCVFSNLIKYGIAPNSAVLAWENIFRQTQYVILFTNQCWWISFTVDAVGPFLDDIGQMTFPNSNSSLNHFYKEGPLVFMLWWVTPFNSTLDVSCCIHHTSNII
jgi:hypothetical protein